MSIHKSLVTKGRLKRHRNVLSRNERILKLEEEEKWSEQDSVFSLPKVRVARLKRAHAKKKEEAEGEGAVEAAEGAVEAAGTTDKPAGRPATGQKK